MVESLTVFIPGPPRGKERPRFGGGRAYSAPATRAREKTMAQIATFAMTGRPLFEGPLSITIVAVYNYPESWSRKKCEATFWKTSKPDIDNVAKLIDSFNKIVWSDDAQVVQAHVFKHYGNEEGTTFIIEQAASGLKEST